MDEHDMKIAAAWMFAGEGFAAIRRVGGRGNKNSSYGIYVHISNMEYSFIEPFLNYYRGTLRSWEIHPNSNAWVHQLYFEDEVGIKFLIDIIPLLPDCRKRRAAILCLRGFILREEQRENKGRIYGSAAILGPLYKQGLEEGLWENHNRKGNNPNL